MMPTDCSLVLRLSYGSTSFLFTGDAEREEEAGDPGGRLRAFLHGA